MFENTGVSISRLQLISILLVIGLTVLVTVLMALDTQVWSYVISLFLIVIIGALSLRLIQMIPDQVDSQIERRAFWTGLLLRLIFAFAFHGLLALVNFRGYSGLYFDDESYYFQLGSSAANSLSYGRDVLAGLEWNYVRHLGNVPFVYLIAILFSAFGKDMLIIRLWVCLVGALVIPLTYRSSMLVLRDEHLARRVMWISTIFPTLVLWSVAPLREILLVFLMILGTYLSLSSLPFPIRVISGILVTILTGMLRFVMGLAFASILLTAIVFRNNNRSPLAAFFKLFLIISVFVISLFVVQNDPNISLSFENSVTRYGTVASEARAEKSAIQSNTLAEDLLRSVRILLLPHPLTSIGNDFPVSIIGVMEGTAWYILFPGIIAGYLVIFPKIELRYYALFILPVVITLYSGTEAGSTWEPQRARLIIYPFLIMCAVVGWQTIQNRMLQQRTTGSNHISFVLLVAHGIIVIQLLLVLASAVSQILNMSLFARDTLLLMGGLLCAIMSLVFVARGIRRN